MADARVLTCPQCGAAAAPDSRECGFCRARLATVACPACFGLVFIGSRHCVHCGGRAKDPTALDGTPWVCPSNHGELRGLALGGAEVGECPACAGLWLDEATFQHVVADRARDSVVPQGGAAELQQKPIAPEKVRYRPCCECGKVMNRVNFGKSSGIIVDACRGHGVWCDADELRRIVEFVRLGGLDVARRRETESLALERQRLEYARLLDKSAPQTRTQRVVTRVDRMVRGEPDRSIVGAGMSLLLALLRD